MKIHAALLTLLTLTAVAPGGADPGAPAAGTRVRMPWRQAGLTEAEAAAHLLDRFAYGARPGEVEARIDRARRVCHRLSAESLVGDYVAVSGSLQPTELSIRPLVEFADIRLDVQHRGTVKNVYFRDSQDVATYAYQPNDGKANGIGSAGRTSRE
jgi:hypothetical protein